MTVSASKLSRLEAVPALQDIGQLFYEKNWSLGTSSNYSVVLDREPLQLLITASGKDKRSLGAGDFLVIDASGNATEAGAPRPSAETLLHVAAARRDDVGAVLHTHSVWSTVLSDAFEGKPGFWIEGFEMLKGLSGISTHEERVWVPIFENTQDIKALAATVDCQFNARENPLKHGYLIRRHGLYTWGQTLAEARRHVEIFEFLFEVMGRKLSITVR